MYNQNIKVSVIIPVYNVEPYLKECLDSITNQTLKEIEIICIDDCSTDNSYKILEEYAKKDNRFILIKNEKNSGVAIARNCGIKKAVGEYIYFIDPDDYISLNYIEELYNTAKKYDSDITSNLNILHDKDGTFIDYVPYCNIKSKELSGKSEVSIINQKKNTEEYLHVVVWNKIFKRKFLNDNNLYFLEIKARCGDINFSAKVLMHNPKTSYNHKGTYYYRFREDSIANQANSLSNVDINIRAMQHFYDAIEYYKINNPNLLKYLYTMVWGSTYYLFNSSIESNKKLFYKHINKFADEIYLEKELVQNTIHREYLLIKTSDTYEKYLLQKELFEQIKLLDNKINKIINEQNSKIKLFGIDNLKDRKIIYIFGIKITIKK
ncbi:glycosyltransferase [Brachyspira pilosicoli]|uniref:glycosyltransferase n=1 Tax=Brachyspira pilosicoli TaxID=52584 RepID=UPI003004CC52